MSDKIGIVVQLDNYFEGPNVKLFQMLQGGFIQPCVKRNREQISSSKMIEKVVNRKNKLKGYRQVVSNGGSAGVDGMSVKELSSHLRENRDRIVTAVLMGKYLPQFILGAAIPKSNGKKRLLGIPTVTDRLLQQAVHQVIGPKFEVEFMVLIPCKDLCR